MFGINFLQDCKFEEIFSGTLYMEDDVPKHNSLVMINHTDIGQTISFRLGLQTHACEGIRGFTTQDQDILVLFPPSKIHR